MMLIRINHPCLRVERDTLEPMTQEQRQHAVRCTSDMVELEDHNTLVEQGEDDKLERD
jgi:hypothetical protein